jgi:hypothetical protein
MIRFRGMDSQMMSNYKCFHGLYAIKIIPSGCLQSNTEKGVWIKPYTS